MRSLLGKSAFRRRPSITAFVSFLIIMLLYVPLATSSLNASTTIGSFGAVSYVGIRPLHVEGRYIKDDLGNIILLRGVQKGWTDDPNGWWSPVGSSQGGFGVWNPDAVKANLDAMKSWGCNVVDFLTIASFWIDDDTGYRQHVKDVCDWAAERGMYVQYELYKIKKEGGYIKLPYPPWLLEGEESYIPDETAFIDFWGDVAQGLGSKPNIIFHLFAEPTADQDGWFNVSGLCIDKIREVEDTYGYIHHLIVVQWYDSPWVSLDHPGGEKQTMEWVNFTNCPSGENIVYSSSFYRAYGSTGIYDGGDRGWTYDECKYAMELEKIDWVAETLNKPFMIREIGCDLWASNFTQELTAFKNVLSTLNEWNISYIVNKWRTDTRWAILANQPYVPPPNAVGQITIDAIEEGGTFIPA